MCQNQGLRAGSGPAPHFMWPTRACEGCTAGKISIEHVTIFRSKYISKDAIDMKFSPDVGNSPSNLYLQRNQNKQVQKLSYV